MHYTVLRGHFFFFFKLNCSACQGALCSKPTVAYVVTRTQLGPLAVRLPAFPGNIDTGC